MGRKKSEKSWEQFNDLLTLEAQEFAEKYKTSEKYAKERKRAVVYRIIRNMERADKDPDFELNPEQQEEASRLQEILQEMKDAGLPIEPEDAKNVVGWKIWEMGVKDAEGNIQSRVMRSAQFQPSPEDLHDALIREAPPITIKPAKVTRTKSKDKRAIIVPDLQGGYRRHGDELEPIHDENVVEVGLQIIRHAQPDLIVLNGDNLDFPDLSRFAPDSNHFQNVMQATIDRVHEILAQMRASAPDSEIVWLAGNHEERLNKAILKHNMQLWGLKRPQASDDYSWLSVGHLMNLEEIGVRYISGYPANRFLINDRLQAVHGDRVRSRGSTAPVYANEEELSTIYGHVHRREAYARTNRMGRVIMGLSYGTWARTDGAVPSYGNSVDDEGRVVPRQENWQNGMGVIEYRDGDSPFQEHFIHIDKTENYKTNWDSREFKPNGERTV